MHRETMLPCAPPIDPLDPPPSSLIFTGMFWNAIRGFHSLGASVAAHTIRWCTQTGPDPSLAAKANSDPLKRVAKAILVEHGSLQAQAAQADVSKVSHAPRGWECRVWGVWFKAWRCRV
jgi:hypothetical protein